MSDSGADTAGIVAAAAVASRTAAGKVAVVAVVGVVAAAAVAVVGEPVAVVGENLLRVRQSRGLFPGRLNMAAGFPEGQHPAKANIGVVLFKLPVGWSQAVLYTSQHCLARYFVVPLVVRNVTTWL